MANEPVPGALNSEGVAQAEPTAPHVPAYLRVWRAVWGTNPTPTTDGSPAPTDGTREIIETIVFVVVLVLMLRCFVAEAFVIPTGSMAETLYGYQKMITCPQCGFFFPVNCSTEVEDLQEGRRPSEVRAVNGCTCPNCRLRIGLTRPNYPVPALRDVDQTIPDPGYSTGDRVLVGKFLYDLLGRSPDRLDVVVFKFPGDGEKGDWPTSGPQQRGVPMNYIKRLVGLPGETIYIYRGDLYHSAVPDLTKWHEEDFRGLQTEEEKAARRLELWRSGGRHGDRYDYTHSQLLSPTSDAVTHQAIIAQMRSDQIRIVRKPAEKILSTRRIVYDNDHQAADLRKMQPRWSPDGGVWTVSGDQGTEFTGKGGQETAWVRYRHLLRGENTPQLIGDFLGYNTDPSTGLRGGDQHWVKDLVLECEVEVARAEGKFSLELSSGVDRFRAVWDLADGFCTLYRIQSHPDNFAGALGLDKGEKLATQATKLKGPGKYRVRFANVDRQLVVWVDGALPFGTHGVAYDAPENEGHVDANGRQQPARLGLADGEVTVRHVSLWRDIFYTNGRTDGDSSGLIRSMYVQPGHYLCMGDNSPASSDGRSWGLVPGRLLLGKAQMVYYPFYFPWWPLKAPVNRVGLIR